MKHKLLSLMAFFLPMAASAYDVCIDGIYYDVVKKAKQATVTYRDQNTWGGATFYHGDVVIPSTIVFEGVVCDVVAIGENTFNECYGLTSVSIPNSVKSIGKGAFDGSHWKPNLKALYISDISTWLNMEINSNPLAISDHLYINGVEVTDLKIPTGISKIPVNSFNGAKMLKSVTIPEGVTVIGASAFANCAELVSINIPESVTELGYSAFSGCTTLNNVILPSGITTISSGLFYQSGLTSITIPNNVTELGDAAFRYCENLKSIYFGTGLKTSGFTVFDGCDNLENVYISDLTAWIKTDFVHPFSGDVTTSWTAVHRAGGSNPLLYAKHLFLNGKEINDLVIPDGVTNVPIGAFPGFSGITSVTIPNSVETCSFKGCKNMKSIIAGNGIKEFNIYDCENILSLTLGDGQMNVKISGCEKLEKLALGKRTLSCNVMECKELSDVYCYSILPPSADFSEDCMVEYVTLHVKETALESYKATKPWNNFGTIMAVVEGDPGYLEPTESVINFQDQEVWRICVDNWDSNGDIELSKEEAANVRDLGIAFKDNKKVTSFDELQFFSALTSVPDEAFYGCENMTSVILPKKITTIGKAAFRNCKNLDAIMIPNGVSSISDEAFYGCENITSIILPEKITKIGAYAFRDCNSLEAITIPASITEFGSSAFSGCSSIKVLDFPEGITALKGEGVFVSLNNLERVTIPNSVTSISESFFYNSKVDKLVIGSGLNEFGEYNFDNGIDEVYITDLSAWCRLPFKSSISNPFKNPHHLFLNGEEIKELIIPSDVTEIGYCQFQSCSELISVKLHDNVTKIGGDAFSGCTKLKEVNIPKNVSTIGQSAFWNCTNLEKVTSYIENPKEVSCFPGSWIYKGKDLTITYNNATLFVPKGTKEKYANLRGWFVFPDIIEMESGGDEEDDPDIIKFADSKVKEICLKYWDTDEDGKLSKTEAAAVLWIGNAFVESEITSFNEFSYFTAVTDIDDAAFRKCKNLQEITLPNSATSIGKQTFAYCQNLTKVVMSNSMSFIGDYAFIGCSSLANIELTDNLTKIGVGAFENCSALSTISIPASVFYIGGSPFDTCSGLTSINVDNDNMRYCSVDGVLFDKACTKIVQYPIGKKVSEYAIPATVTTIGEGAFISSANLHGITIPEGVMTIELGAFMDCTGLESITIPQSVESLAKYCFYGCSSLKSVTSMIVNPFEIESNVFETGNGIFTTATLYTPMGSASKYQSTGGWKNFKKFMPIGDVNGDNAINDTDVKEETGYILDKPSKTFVKAAADMNGDGVINVADIVLMNAINLKK